MYEKKCKNKKCEDYNILKPVSEFHKNKQNKDGYHSYCKKCRNKNRMEYHKTYSTNKIKKRNAAGEKLLAMAKKRVGLK